DAVLRWAEDAARRLAELEDGEGSLEQIDARLAAVEARLVALAQQLHEGRAAAARHLGAAVTEELEGLAMTGARLEVAVETAELGPWGADDVRMLLVP